MDVREVIPGVWRWELPHPDWTPEEAENGGWDELVASYFVETPDGPVLIDPLAPRPESEQHDRFWRALDRDVESAARPPSVLLTVFWHARSTQEFVDRYPGARVWAHESAVEQLRERTTVTDTFGPGDALPAGAEAHEVVRMAEVVYRLPEHRALVAGDVLLGDGAGGVRLCPRSWLGSVEPEAVSEALRPLLDLPLDHVLPTHGQPVVGGGREALERALAAGW